MDQGDCLYSSVSILLCNDNDLVEPLRFLTSWELHHNSAYYADHPLLNTTLNQHSNIFANKAAIFATYLSKNTFESYDKANCERSVKDEAANNIRSGEYSSFLCILGLSSVVQRCIEVHHHGVQKDVKYPALFNQVVMPRGCITGDPIDIVWTSTLSSGKPNHFVPLSRISVHETQFSKRHRLQPESDSEDSITPSPLPPNLPSFQPLSPDPMTSESSAHTAKHETESVAETSANDQAAVAPQSDATTSANDHPAVAPQSDISLYFERIDSLSPHQKLELIDNIWRPEKNSNFPKQKVGASIIIGWRSFPAWCIHVY